MPAPDSNCEKRPFLKVPAILRSRMSLYFGKIDFFVELLYELRVYGYLDHVVPPCLGVISAQNASHRFKFAIFESSRQITLLEYGLS